MQPPGPKSILRRAFLCEEGEGGYSLESLYPSTPALKQKQQTRLSRSRPFVNMLPEAPYHALRVSVLPLTREHVKGQIADMGVPSAKMRGIVSSSAGTRQSFPTSEPITEPPAKKQVEITTGVSNDLFKVDLQGAVA